MLEAWPHAKVNLTLEVRPRRTDGYHDLRSVFLRLGLADALRVEPLAVGQADQLTVRGLPGCPIEGNLVLRAFDLLRRAVEPGRPGLAATLDKQIPVGAGLGGGSSDGAAALDLAARAWDLSLSPAQSSDLALAVGSDVPFFAAAVPAALVEGRGEYVTELPAVTGEAGVLLVLSSSPLSTAEVFAQYDRLRRPGSSGPTDALSEALRDGLGGAGLAGMTAELADSNDLWPAASALAPELRERRSVLEHRSGRHWLLSGSGPTLFAIFPTVAEAAGVGRELVGDRSDSMRGVMLCATDLVNTEPAWRQQWPTEP
jgi:4-diphosphocytidyl-2-C-methyl-D-erythritol kinase